MVVVLLTRKCANKSDENPCNYVVAKQGFCHVWREGLVAIFVLSRADNRIRLPATRGHCGNFNTLMYHLKCHTAVSYVCGEGFILQDGYTEEVLFRRVALSKAMMH